MSDSNTGAAGAPAPAASAVSTFLGGFPPGPLPAQEPPAPVATVTNPPEPVIPAPEPPKGPSLADVIRQEREAKQARAQEAARAKDLEAQLADARSEMDRLKRDSDFESDPVAYAKARGWDNEKQALMGQMLLYDLVPDKAPPDLRLRLFESKQARAERERTDAARKAQEEAAAAQSQEQYHNFVTAVQHAAGSFEDGSFPESQAWFGEDQDTYVRSLVATAVNMASAAQRDGRVADLSPASIAKTLEAEVERKMKARDDRAQKRAKPVIPAIPAQQVAAPVAASGMQPTESTKSLYGSGTPAPKAQTDAERTARAVAAAFKPR
jgi:hypothetical protein